LPATSAGSLHLRAETFKAIVCDLAGNLEPHGVRRIAILNTGVLTERPLDDLVMASTQRGPDLS
jgi:hypothetical protein